VKVDIERTETEERPHQPLDHHNKTDELVAWEKFEELNARKQKADDNDTRPRTSIICKNKPAVSKKIAVEFANNKQI
jgi:hypothetical protein